MIFNYLNLIKINWLNNCHLKYVIIGFVECKCLIQEYTFIKKIVVVIVFFSKLIIIITIIAISSP